MGLKVEDAKQLADVRGDTCLLVYEGNKARWYMMPSPYGTIDEVAAIAGPEMLELLEAGELTITDKKGRRLQERIKYSWRLRGPLKLVTAEPG